MTCAEFEMHLQKLLDERQPLELRGEIRAHQADCTNCRDLHLAAGALVRALAWPALPMPPPGFSQRVVATWQRRQRRLLLVRQGLALAASVLFLGLGIGAWSLARGPRTLPGSSGLVQAPPPAVAPTLVMPKPLHLDDARKATLDLGRDVVARAWQDASILMPPDPAIADSLAMAKGPTLTMPDVGHTMDQGLEPVTKNAQRAWSAWSKLLPTPKEERKRS